MRSNNFRKVHCWDLEKISKMLILGPKMPHLTQFQHNKIFLKNQFQFFLSNPTFMQKGRKK